MDEEKLPPKLAWGKPFKAKDVSQFKPVACFRCGSLKFNVKLKMERRKLPKMRLLCAECGRETNMVIRQIIMQQTHQNQKKRVIDMGVDFQYG